MLFKVHVYPCGHFIVTPSRNGRGKCFQEHRIQILIRSGGFDFYLPEFKLSVLKILPEFLSHPLEA